MGRLINWFKGIKVPCKVCSGTGYAAIEVPEGAEDVLCPLCEGKGYISKEVALINPHAVPNVALDDVDDNLICGKASEGKSRLIKEVWERELLCPKCKGKKKVRAKTFFSDTKVICQACAGKGYRIKKGKVFFIGTILFFSAILPYVTFVLVGTWLFLFGLWVAFREAYLTRKKDETSEL